MSNYQHYVKNHLSQLMSTLGLNISYTRAEGDYLYYRDAQGDEVPVLDLLGGYGSLIFGHNHPQIVARAKQLLDQQVPVHAQFSLREGSGELAKKLNQVMQRELNSDEEFAVTFANSGAEAIEAAIKHAELERVLKLQDLLDEVTLNIESVQHSIRVGEAKIPEHIYRHTSIREQVFDVRNFEELIVGLINYNTEQLVKRPIFLVLEKSFHGKLIGSVQLTYNKNFRRPFQYFGLNTRFISPNDPAQLDRVLQEERVVIFDLAVNNGEVAIVERDIPIFCAFLIEPIQGEGGVNLLNKEFAQQVRKTCNQLDCPLIIDEIQSGMGRSGTFLASTQIPVKGDYYTFSKSLGGGIAKVSATLIKKSRLRKEFSLVHSSTFAEDDYSSGIALTVLNMLDDVQLNAYKKINSSSTALREALIGVQQKFPDVIRDVRGLGLFLGVEFFEQKNASSILFRGASYNDSFGYLLAGYLLHEERIRIAPPGSAPNVLRIEPSLFLTETQISHIAEAFARLCQIIQCQDALHLAFPLTQSKRGKPRVSIDNHHQDFTAKAASHAGLSLTRPVRKVAFINHLISPELLAEVDPSLQHLNSEELRNFIERMEPNKKTAPFPPVRIQSPLGVAVDFYLYPLCVSSHQMVNYLNDGNLDGIRDDIQDRILAAQEEGCEIAGLGMYTSIVTNNCTSLKIPDMTLTSGNALTIGMALEAIEQAIADQRIAIDDMTVVVVGAAGNIASTYASLLSEKCTRLILLGSERSGSLNRLQQTVYTIYEDTWQEINSKPFNQLGALAKKLIQEPIIQEWIECKNAPVKVIGKTIANAIAERHGADPYVTISTDLTLVKQGNIVLCSANSAEPFLGADDFGMNAIICDIAVPNNVQANIVQQRPDIIYQQGGIVATPNGESLHPTARAFLGAGQLFACMAETVILGLAGINQHYSYGAISKQQVREILALAKAHGFSLASYKKGNSL
ncbi:aminotransferase class III-fold pyridoxal phosphate-dependent enzyme [Cellvibrio fibrivorans]|uniref:Acetylornithine/succinyldiaminopimelate/putresci ne aminotransferase/predicted amino acid dehydrogenase n=1 Tax=Cellvibrio fibrivorans TaxID=126350 RepID=A0ABU1UZT4_9GAMM|nr:aminotransferase class III-fold pyridoxal phosphate-dependent enzyme [Cellvibrio fibrivorans]MDR7090638.1 acetylornithine/succinyldiaminopimelate/putrescine aminotransferase/predicted amino acid dehydrogenase [Cellvibrio fibrivorans]